MPMDNGIDDIEFLARSPNRVQILETLAETGHAEKDELQATIDGSRTTLTRNLYALEDRGWIQTANPTCTVTPAGQELVEDFLDVVKSMEVGMRFEEFFKWLSADEFDLDIQALADAELFTPEQEDPYAMINRHVEKLEETEHSRVLLPLTGLHAHETGHEQILTNGAEVELVVTPDVADTHQSAPKYDELTTEMVATNRFDLYVYEGTIPYGLALLDETVQILVDEDGEPRAMLESDGEQVQQWAEHTYETYKNEALPVSL